MTELGTIALEGPSDAHPTNEAVPLESRGFIRDTLLTVSRRGSARLGMGWILILIFCAIFAPFLANSMPFVMKYDGHWSFPLFRFLTPADLVLQICLWSCVAIYFTRRRAPLVPITILSFAALLSVLSLVLVRPPGPMLFASYLDAARSGNAKFMWRAPIQFSPDDHLDDQPQLRNTPPTAHHLLGVTSGRADLLSNMIYASRIALSIGFISTGIAVIVGCTLGGLMGYYGGLIDLLGMRLAEIFNAIPTLLLLLCFVAVFEPNLYIMMAIIGLTSWVGYATFVRAEFLSLRDRDFVHAARAAGVGTGSILFRHMLPNGITPVLVSASFGVAGAILAESTLSFLGIGLKGEASWGGLLNQATSESGTFYWWIALYPGLAIFLTVFSYNLIGEALRDALDPKLLKR
jgi:peptide/nickel transport system permease protein